MYIPSIYVGKEKSYDKQDGKVGEQKEESVNKAHWPRNHTTSSKMYKRNRMQIDKTKRDTDKKS